MSDRKTHYSIYLHRNKINNKVYIGQTKQQPPSKRWGNHGENYQDSPRFWAAIQKYGWENFDSYILENELTLDEANKREKYWIQYYKSQNPIYGYNIQNGGYNHTVSEETKQKISQTKINNYHPYRGNHLSEEHKQKISNSMKGTNNHFYGQHHTKETKEKMSKNHADVNGSNNPRAISVLCVETGIIYGAISEAAIAIGKDKKSGGSNIRKVLDNPNKTAYGYHWERRK